MTYNRRKWDGPRRTNRRVKRAKLKHHWRHNRFERCMVYQLLPPYRIPGLDVEVEYVRVSTTLSDDKRAALTVGRACTWNGCIIEGLDAVRTEMVGDDPLLVLLDLGYSMQLPKRYASTVAGDVEEEEE